jgi:hypothetical protein
MIIRNDLGESKPLIKEKAMNAVNLTKSEKINMNIRDIAAAVRVQLKQEFPAFTFSVTIERYSMGRSLNINIMSGTIKPFVNNDRCERTEEAKTLIARIEAIANQFNFDESDSMSDYYCVNFHLNVAIGKWPKVYQKI